MSAGTTFPLTMVQSRRHHQLHLPQSELFIFYEDHPVIRHMKITSSNRAYTIVELAVSTAIFSTLGVTLCSLLNVTTILGAKNSAINTAHQQARTAMVQMLEDLHSAISLPYSVDADDKYRAPVQPQELHFKNGRAAPTKSIPTSLRAVTKSR